MAKVLVVGLGFVGVPLADALSSKGHEVYGVCRSEKNSKAHLIQADIFSLAKQDIPRDVDYVFYMLSAGSRSIEAYKKAYPVGLEHILNIIDTSKVKRLFYISSTGVYAQSNGEWLDEDSPTQPLEQSKDSPNEGGDSPNKAYAQILLEAESIAANCGLSSTIVRFGGLYGPDRNRIVKSVFDKTAKKLLHDVYTNRIHQVDAAGVLAYLMEKEELDDLYIGVDSCPSLYNDVLSWIEEKAGVELEMSSEPSSRGSKRLSNQRLLNSGYTFKYPDFKSGYLEVINAMINTR